MSKVTEHGENIATQIQGCDAYGQDCNLTYADVWIILDNIYSQFCDEEIARGITDSGKQMLRLLSKWMDELEAIDEDATSILKRKNVTNTIYTTLPYKFTFSIPRF